MADKVPGKAWVVTFAGTAINLCLGILYAWSVWAKELINEKMAVSTKDGHTSTMPKRRRHFLCASLSLLF